MRARDRLRYDERAGALRKHDRATGKRDLVEAETRLAQLDLFFRQRRAAAIGIAAFTDDVARVSAARTR